MQTALVESTLPWELDPEDLALVWGQTHGVGDQELRQQPQVTAAGTYTCHGKEERLEGGRKHAC